MVLNQDFKEFIQSLNEHYVHFQIQKLVNIQNVNGQAKPHQIRQFLKLVEEYNLELRSE